MTIRTRLALGIFAIAAVLLIPLLLSLRSLRRVDDDVSRLQSREIEQLVLLRRASDPARAAPASLPPVLPG